MSLIQHPTLTRCVRTVLNVSCNRSILEPIAFGAVWAIRNKIKKAQILTS